MIMAGLRSIYNYIDAHKTEHISKIQEFLRQPSVSDGAAGEVQKCAELLRQYYQDLGCVEAELVETDGHPGVWAYYDAGAEKTIINYCMYDTMPVQEDEGWVSPPFDANLVDGKLIGLPSFASVIVARGAYNSKGPYRAWLNALESIIAVEGKPPVNIMFVAEGEEELGSPHLGQIIQKYEHRLKVADAVLDLEATQNQEGKVSLSLGYKGNIYFDMECTSEALGKGARRDVHSSLRPILDSPLVHLIQAISSMFEPDGLTPAIEDLAMDIQPWAEDLDLIKRLAEDADFLKEFAEENDVINWTEGLSQEELVYRLFYGNNLNINGISSGYSGPGAKTVIPRTAACKVNIRLVPNQEPETVMGKVRAHLQKRGFSAITIKAPESSRVKDKDYIGYTWAKTSVNEPVVQAVLETYAAHNVPVRIRPHSAGSEPKYLFNRPPLNLPMCLGGLGHGGRHHSPNEYFVIEGNDRVGGMIECEKSHVEILYNYAQT